MKQLLLFLSLFLLSLLGAKDNNVALSEMEEAGVEFALLEDEPTGYILPSALEVPDEGEAFVDVEALARQYRVIGRGQRSFSVQQLVWEKSAAYRAAKKRLDILLHVINRVYTTLPCQSWKVSADHYVFGMRHILI